MNLQFKKTLLDDKNICRIDTLLHVTLRNLIYKADKINFLQKRNTFNP